jgi:hypothetical protein
MHRAALRGSTMRIGTAAAAVSNTGLLLAHPRGGSALPTLSGSVRCQSSWPAYAHSHGTFAWAEPIEAGAGGAENTQGHGFRALVKKHGLPFALYYVFLAESLTAIFAFLLFYDYLGVGDLTDLLKDVGLEKWLDVDHAMANSKSIGPITISGKLITSFFIGKGFVAVLTPLKLPFAIATLPYVERQAAKIFPKMLSKVKERAKKAAHKAHG